MKKQVPRKKKSSESKKTADAAKTSVSKKSETTGTKKSVPTESTLKKAGTKTTSSSKKKVKTETTVIPVSKKKTQASQKPEIKDAPASVKKPETKAAPASAKKPKTKDAPASVKEAETKDAPVSAKKTKIKDTPASAKKVEIKADPVPVVTPEETSQLSETPASEEKKPKKRKLKKSVKVAFVTICAACLIFPLVIGKISQHSAAIEEDQNVIQVDLSETLPPTEPTTEEPTTEPETEPDPDAPFIDYEMEIDPSKPMIAVTYDDGPSAESSPKILDILEEYGAHATFFVVGENITEDTEDILKREIELGCEIGNHSWAHENLRELGTEAALESLKSCHEKIFEATGRNVHLVRPPYGAYTDEIREENKSMFIYWSVDTNDWKFRNADKVYDVLMDNVDDGDIILMHDIHPETAEAAERIIPDLIEAGYQLVTVSELMYYRHLDPEDGMLVFNVHPENPYFDSLFGTVYEPPTEEPTETDTSETTDDPENEEEQTDETAENEDQEDASEEISDEIIIAPEEN